MCQLRLTFFAIQVAIHRVPLEGNQAAHQIGLAASAYSGSQLLFAEYPFVTIKMQSLYRLYKECTMNDGITATITSAKNDYLHHDRSSYKNIRIYPDIKKNAAPASIVWALQ